MRDVYAREVKGAELTKMEKRDLIKLLNGTFQPKIAEAIAEGWGYNKEAINDFVRIAKNPPRKKRVLRT